MSFSERQKRAIKKRDGFECQLSKKFGIAVLTGIPCSEELEVHHKNYPRNRRVRMYDGITVCKRCHDALTDLIRRNRNSGRPIEPGDYSCEEPWKRK